MDMVSVTFLMRETYVQQNIILGDILSCTGGFFVKCEIPI